MTKGRGLGFLSYYQSENGHEHYEDPPVAFETPCKVLASELNQVQRKHLC